MHARGVVLVSELSGIIYGKSPDELGICNTTRPSLFMDNSDDESDDDDDACVEILLVTPIRSAAVIPSSRELYCSHSSGQGMSSEDSNFNDFFLFSAGHYYATYPKGGVAGNCEFTREEWDAPYQPTIGVLTKKVFKDPTVYKTMVDQFPTSGQMVRVESLSDDQLTMKMSVLYCMMMSHGGELLARYRGLLQSHHEYVFSADSRLKGYEERIAGLTGLELQVSALNEAGFLGLMTNFPPPMLLLQSPRLSVGFEGALSMHRTKDEFAAISEHVGEPLFVILQLEPEKLALSANVPASRDARVVPTSSVVASEQNEEWVNVMVDGPDPRMIDGATHAKSESAFVQGTSYVLDEVAEVTVVGSECVSSSPGDVVVALSVV
ncbi:hypothetical protein Tco_0135006 [Tanacetum coccineum]